MGPGASLSDGVAAAEADRAAGDVAGACGELRSFIHEVHAQAGKHIPADEAATLVADAIRIVAGLSC